MFDPSVRTRGTTFHYDIERPLAGPAGLGWRSARYCVSQHRAVRQDHNLSVLSQLIGGCL